MTRQFISLFALIILLTRATFSQANHSPFPDSFSDTTSIESVQPFDSTSIQQSRQLGKDESTLTGKHKQSESDIQQLNNKDKSAIVFILLVVMLSILTYINVSFRKDIDELFQSFVNSNIAQQIFRAQSGEISFSSFLLHTNFIISISLYTQFILFNYFHFAPVKNFSSLLSLIFLFTFFYVSKVVLLRLIGTVFEVAEECNEYLFNFSTFFKIVGLALIPALFVFYTNQGKFFNLIFGITIFILVVFAAMFLWRGLSTGSKLMYRSVYHFFIYVCVAEISPIFLLFKLLTKTIT